jgi:hypothetical protein
MAFEQETGTGSSTSNSYASVAQFEAYWTDRGTDYTATAQATKEAWLILATEYIDNYYKFEGSIVTETQALEWPRSGATGKGGYSIDNDTIPTDLINATVWLASQSVNGLNPVDYGVKSESYGPVSKEYNKSSTMRDYPVVRKLLKYFVISGNKLQRVN